MAIYNPNPPDFDSVHGAEPPDPGSETRSPAANTEAADDGTGLGSEFQRHRLEAQARQVEGLAEHGATMHKPIESLQEEGE